MPRTLRDLTLLATLVLLVAPAQGQQDHAQQERDPRTPSGRPDFSGTYDVATLTPLTREAKYGDKLFLTREEAEEIERQEAEGLAKGAGKSDPNRDAPPEGGAPPVGLDDSFRESSGAGNVGGYNNFWIDRGSGAFEIDGRYRTSIVTDPASGQLPAMTADGMKRLQALFGEFRRSNDGTAWWLDEEGPGPYDDPERRPLAERCLLGFGSTQGPPMLPVLYNNHKRIIQTEDDLMILVEMNHDARIIPILAEGEEAPPSAEGIEKWLGDSHARWEGDTLVIRTKDFREESGLFFASDALEVEERFSRLDGDTLHYQFTVSDPKTWKESWSGDYVWPSTDNKVFEYACHEGNHALGGILRGARVLEQDVLGEGNGQ